MSQVASMASSIIDSQSYIAAAAQEGAQQMSGVTLVS